MSNCFWDGQRLEPVPAPECREAVFGRELQAAYHADPVLGALRELLVDLINRASPVWTIDITGEDLQSHCPAEIQQQIDVYQKQMRDRRLQIFDDLAERMGMTHGQQ